MYQATVVIKLQSFSGDANGNLFGNFGLYASAEDANANKPPFGNLSVQSKLVDGVNPLVTLDGALKARTDIPALAEVA